MTKLISVIMPVYNASAYLSYSIESILNQSFKDFQFILINDGSTDKSLEIIKTYYDIDKRIKIIDKDNTGAASSFNLGLKIAKSKFIARMDSDDISLPKRFEEQLKYFEKFSNIDVLGTGINLIDSKGKSIKSILFPQKHSDILKRMELTSPMANPTVMIKKKLFDELGPLDTNTDPADDYDFIVRALIKKKIVTNLNKVLLKYRIHQNNLSKINNTKQIDISYKSREKLISEGLLVSNISKIEYQIRNLPTIDDKIFDEQKLNIEQMSLNSKKVFFYKSILTNIYSRRLITQRNYYKGIKKFIQSLLFYFMSICS